MKISGFIWLEQYVDKLAEKHGVYPDEVIEVLDGKPLIHKVQRGKTRGEHLYRALGQTNEGRYLIILFIRKISGKALPISARDMDSKEQRIYGRR